MEAILDRNFDTVRECQPVHRSKTSEWSAHWECTIPIAVIQARGHSQFYQGLKGTMSSTFACLGYRERPWHKQTNFGLAFVRDDRKFKIDIALSSTLENPTAMVSMSLYEFGSF